MNGNNQDEEEGDSSTSMNDYQLDEEVEEIDEKEDYEEVSNADFVSEVQAEIISEEEAEIDPGLIGEEKVGEIESEDDDIEKIEEVEGYKNESLDATEVSFEESEKDDKLLDAWYGEYGDPIVGAILKRPKEYKSLLEVVIGRDDRIKITNTTKYIWRCICHLRITTKDGKSFGGTGWLVGNRTVITAGHCVFMRHHGGWVRKIEVIPGRNGGTKPYKSCTAYKFHSVKGWTKKHKRSNDYGAIILPKDCKYGKRLGYFGYANYGRSTLKNMKVNLSGYPGDKPTGTQWWDCRKIKKVTSRTIVYNTDTAGGQSGSPVWRKKGNKRYAVGIHTNGSSSGNSATRIVKPVFKNIKKWKKLGK
jgi:V8-like Glu-specific endopeptidase